MLRPQPALALAILLSLASIMSACAPEGGEGNRTGFAPGFSPLARSPVTSAQVTPVHEAGLILFDALAPTVTAGAADPYQAMLGARQMPTGLCDGRYANDGLIARCAALSALVAYAEAGASGVRAAPIWQEAKRVISPLSGGVATPFLAALEMAPQSNDAVARALIRALRADAPVLYRVERAARAVRLQAQDRIFLEAMDEIVAVIRGRRAPDGSAARIRFDGLAVRAATAMAQEAPGYGYASLAEVMGQGPALTLDDVTRLERSLASAEAALGTFDQIAAEWRDIAGALSAYDRFLAAADQPHQGLHHYLTLQTGAMEIIRRLAGIERDRQ